MMIIIYSSQMVISAIAMEKQNKTLETLLTVPISRASIVTAKMLAAGLAGLLSAAIYMLGFRNYMSGLTGDIASAPGVSQVVQKLGLALDAKALVLLGVSLFFAILCALAMATILGVLAEDFRSAQSLIMPMVFLVMIPYFITLFTDVKSLSLPVKSSSWPFLSLTPSWPRRTSFSKITSALVRHSLHGRPVHGPGRHRGPDLLFGQGPDHETALGKKEKSHFLNAAERLIDDGHCLPGLRA